MLKSLRASMQISISLISAKNLSIKHLLKLDPMLKLQRRVISANSTITGKVM